MSKCNGYSRIYYYKTPLKEEYWIDLHKTRLTLPPLPPKQTVLDMETYNMNMTLANLQGGRPEYALRYESFGDCSALFIRWV